MFSDIIIVAIIGGAIQLIIWAGSKLLDYRRNNKQDKKIESETKNIDAETNESLRLAIADLTEKYLDVNNKHLKTYEELSRLSLDVDSYKSEITLLKAQMINVREENIKLKSDIIQLQKENYSLKEESGNQKKLIEKERGESEKLREGINILMTQLKEKQVSPVWKPRTGPLPPLPANTPDSKEK